MRLQTTDLISYCRNIKDYTNGKYDLIPTKSDYGYWTLTIVNTENGASDKIVSGLLLREAHEVVRGICGLLRFNGGL